MNKSQKIERERQRYKKVEEYIYFTNASTKKLHPTGLCGELETQVCRGDNTPLGPLDWLESEETEFH